MSPRIVPEACDQTAPVLAPSRTAGGRAGAFADLSARRRAVTIAPGVDVQLPGIDDLILTKRFGARPKDLEDIRLLHVLASDRPSESEP